MQYEYYYQKLRKDERVIYRILVDDIKSLKEISVFENDKAANIPKIVRAIEYDHPELYYWKPLEIKTKINGSKMAYKIDYYWTPKEISENKPKLEKGIKAILSKCKNLYEDEFDRFKCIYDCMARNISYDYESAKTNMNGKYAHTILGVFAKQTAVCDGISKAFKLVLEQSGIDCIVVSGCKKGEGSSEKHAWNIVFINDKPFHVDLTWAVESSDKNRISHDYVGLTDRQIQKDHFIDTILDVPKCSNKEYDFYVRNGSNIRSTAELKEYLDKQAIKKPFELNMRLDYQCDIEETAKIASDYVIERFVVQGQYVKIKSQFRVGQNILVLIGT